MNTRQQEVITAFCALGTEVRDHLEGMHGTLPSDCFCPDAGRNLTYSFSPLVVEFIQQAVREKMERD